MPICVLCLLTAMPAFTLAADTDDAIAALKTYYEMGNKNNIEGMKSFMSRAYRQNFEATIAENKDLTEITLAIAAKTEFNIQGATMQGEIIVISVLANSPDFRKMIQAANKSIKAADQNEYNRLLAVKIGEMLNKGDYTMSESEAEIQMTKEDGGWKITN